MHLAVPMTTINTRSTWRHPQAVFHTLLLLTLGANAVFAGVSLPSARSWRLVADTALTATSVNVGIATLIRQQYVVNALFRLATRAPRRLPLRQRILLAEVYQYGGLHVGAAVAATVWFLFFAATTVAHAEHHDGLVLAFTAVIAVDVIVIVACGLPAMRQRRHDLFEATHRYGGWAALALFAALTVLLAQDDPRGLVAGLVHSPAAWILAGATISVLIPWLQVRRVAVAAHVPSGHAAVLHLPAGRRAVAGTFVRLSHRPLGQSHAFAAIPDASGSGYRVVVSRAGDWTAKLIDSPPDRVWVRGVPVAGVASVARLFRRVVWLATGSGIAPCLPQLLAVNATPAQLIWVTRNPLRTYGPELLDEIRAAAPDAQIWDTDAEGKPDLVRLATYAYLSTGAEAVICISNQDTTRRLVTDLRRRGVPAYGPIWDS